MEIISNGFSIFAVILGVVGVLGGAVGYFAKGRGDAIIAYQAKELLLNKDTVARLEKEVTALTAERDSLLTQNHTLTKLAQGSPQLKSVSRELSKLSKLVGKIVEEKGHAK